MLNLSANRAIIGRRLDPMVSEEAEIEKHVRELYWQMYAVGWDPEPGPSLEISPEACRALCRYIEDTGGG
jgi:hypothetical protein